MAAIVCGIIATSAATTTYAMESVSEGWHGEGVNSYYINNEGARVTGWLNDDLGVFYFNEAKELQVGWQEIEGKKFFFDEVTGQQAIGATLIGEQSYFFQRDGQQLSGWQDNKTRYYNEFGFSLTGDQTIDGVSYRFDAEGKLHTGWFETREGSYFYSEDGTMTVGRANLNDTIYYFHEDGKMAKSEEVSIDGEVRYFDADGTIRTGWYTNEENNRYYYDEEGNKEYGLQDIDGDIYYFNENGIMLRDDKAEGYEFDSYGVGSKEVVKEVEESQSTPTPQSTQSNDNDHVASTDVGSSAVGGSVYSSAMGQLGVYQDCTMLVTNALSAVGIYHHGWPASYMGLGTIVSASEAQAGDILYYADGGAGMAHVAVYIGGGQAVHGGWLGNQTVVNSAYVGSGPVFIRLP